MLLQNHWTEKRLHIFSISSSRPIFIQQIIQNRQLCRVTTDVRPVIRFYINQIIFIISLLISVKCFTSGNRSYMKLVNRRNPRNSPLYYPLLLSGSGYTIFSFIILLNSFCLIHENLIYIFHESDYGSNIQLSYPIHLFFIFWNICCFTLHNILIIHFQKRNLSATLLLNISPIWSISSNIQRQSFFI